MAPRNQKPQVVIDSWRGFDSFNDVESLRPDVWPDSLNVVVNPNGNALALRSPQNFNDALATTNKVLSAFYYDRQAGGVILYDINATSGSNVATYSTAGSANTSRRTGQADARWHSVNVNDKAYRVNGSEFIQYVTGLDAYAVGITAPAAAPTVSFVAGGSGSVATGVTVSYAYRNSTTLHIGEASPVSADTGATGANLTLRVAVTASAQTGVDGIVLFITQDAGSVRYLYTDASGDPVVHANATGNIDISVALLDNLNYNVEETAFNAPPPSTGKFLFKWKGRLCLCGFTAATTRQQIQYSGYDQIFYGQPWEAWPPLNILTIPSKSESVKGGVDTPIGALILSDRDAYLLAGTPTDKIDSGENTLQVTEQLRQLAWKVGTRSPLTIQNTPFGVMFLDQDKHLQFWPFQGQPQEVAIGLREDLGAILDTDSARDMAEARWFSSGDNGGFYVLTASTSGTTNNRMWIVTVIQRPDGLFIAGTPSDIAAQCLEVAQISGEWILLAGVTDRLRELLDFDTAGAGWPSGTSIYFDLIANNDTLFSTLYALRFDGTNTGGVNVQVRNLDDTDIRAMQTRTVGGSHSALVNCYGTRQKLRFNFDSSDTVRQEIKNVRLISSGKKRVL